MTNHGSLCTKKKDKDGVCSFHASIQQHAPRRALFKQARKSVYGLEAEVKVRENLVTKTQDLTRRGKLRSLYFFSIFSLLFIGTTAVQKKVEVSQAELKANAALNELLAMIPYVFDFVIHVYQYSFFLYSNN